jgi:tRNA(Ile)-lysidine synthetase-like protein
MRPEGMKGRKKLQDILIDDKVPREAREAVVLAAAGSEILMICPPEGRVRRTADYAINSATKRLFLLEYILHT